MDRKELQSTFECHRCETTVEIIDGYALYTSGLATYARAASKKSPPACVTVPFPSLRTSSGSNQPLRGQPAVRVTVVNSLTRASRTIVRLVAELLALASRSPWTNLAQRARLLLYQTQIV